ncbi:hypothetical protein JOF56_009008 [Kibdelosporangium banguiense]|uniref:Uncharacterized protein n=1 Tax=Kibdelosporangium banguiense TaxID=1365924 RepID=A0ABS4TW37_9PSEU|nr:hypothetical protein [Kibdelosporangium banguiense]
MTLLTASGGKSQPGCERETACGNQYSSPVADGPLRLA